jgi:hypothetical protein
LSLLGGAGTISLLTGNWIAGVAALGAEALWMLFAPDSRLLRHFWFDKKHALVEAAREGERRRAAIAALPDQQAESCRRLVEKKAEIDALCTQNPAFTADLLRNELAKLDALVRSYIELAGDYVRFANYLQTIDVGELERDLRRYSSLVDEASKDDERRPVAMKNLEVLQRRKAKVAELKSNLGTARSQIDLIENTFDLLADQIVTMRRPEELSGQLDTLLDGVEAIRETAIDTERILGPMDKEL